MPRTRVRLTFLLLLVALLCSCGGGLGSRRCVGEVTEVRNNTSSGTTPIRWWERYVISANTVHLTRTGDSTVGPGGFKINTGTWTFDVDPQQVRELFDRLEAVDWRSVREVKPAPGRIEIGGGQTSYSVYCERDTSRHLSYGDGTTYTNGSSVTKPIEAFIHDLALPEDAGRFISTQPTD